MDETLRDCNQHQLSMDQTGGLSRVIVYQRDHMSSSGDSRTSSPADTSEDSVNSPKSLPGIDGNTDIPTDFSNSGGHVAQHHLGNPSCDSGSVSFNPETPNPGHAPRIRPVGITIPTTTNQVGNLHENQVAQQPLQQVHAQVATKSRKSERGLSYLFPSLVDQHLSLLEKVQITLERHVNNYFLHWSEEDLLPVRPLVRPKMVISPEIYKKYCHRNAMKYDSNLQFAMSSDEPWGQEFRNKLSIPPSEGGFSSLCEVKQEAGALWRKYGKYKMHNVIKVQMDINQETYGRQSTEAVASRPVPMGPHQTVYQRNDSSHLHLQQRLNNNGVGQAPPGMAQQCRVSQQSEPVLGTHPQLRNAVSQYINRDMSQCSVSSTWTGPTISSPQGGIFQHRKRKEDSNLQDQYQSAPLTAQIAPSPHNSRMSVSSPENSVTFAASSVNHQPTDPRSHPPCKMARIAEDNLKSILCSQNRNNMGFGGGHHSLITPATTFQDSQLSKFSSNGVGSVSNKSNRTGHFNLEALLKPLSKNLSVSEQLLVWVEWTRNNSLNNLRNVLQNMPQTPEIQQALTAINQFFDPKIARGLDAADKILCCPEPWALKFQQRVTMPVSCGGFETVEDILVEAKKLWEEHEKTSIEDGQPKLFNTPKDRPVVPAETITPVAHNVNLGTPMLSLRKISHVGQVSNPPKVPTQVNSSDRSSIHQQYLLSENTQDHSKPAHMSPIPGHSVANQCPCEPEVGGRKELDAPEDTEQALDLSRSSSRTVLSKLWASRDLLHERCGENLSMSWHERTREFLPLLKDKIGHSYNIPTTTIGCVLDMALCFLHQALKE